MKIREIKAKSILSKSLAYDYALNPYVGCTHNCVYCYARFMKRFTGHKERWEYADESTLLFVFSPASAKHIVE